MKKSLLLILTIFLILISINSGFAQEDEGAAETLPLGQRFGTYKLRDQFNSYIPIMYYRFSPDVQFFDSIDLSYFPHETWNKTEWALLGRWTDGKNYNQIIYTDLPSEKQIIHGTDTGEKRGFLRDFYLYATLFIEDNYPVNTGSCYIYYSDSLLIGFKPSYGILIDPQSGIYEATNSYGGARHATYSPTSIRHTLELLEPLDSSEFAIDPENIPASSIGASEYPKLNMDGEFIQDWEALTGSFRMPASPEVKAYRVEVIREDGISTIYINGKQVYSAADNLRTRNEENVLVPEKASWTYGPILNPGGLTVTCSIGDLIIYSNGK